MEDGMRRRFLAEQTALNTDAVGASRGAFSGCRPLRQSCRTTIPDVTVRFRPLVLAGALYGPGSVPAMTAAGIAASKRPPADHRLRDQVRNLDSARRRLKGKFQGVGDGGYQDRSLCGDGERASAPLRYR